MNRDYLDKLGEGAFLLPGAEENPCCMGTAAMEMLQVLTGFAEEGGGTAALPGESTTRLPSIRALSR